MFATRLGFEGGADPLPSYEANADRTGDRTGTEALFEDGHCLPVRIVSSIRQSPIRFELVNEASIWDCSTGFGDASEGGS